MTRALVIGYGSIGTRHAGLLARLGAEVGAVTRVAECPYPRWTDLDRAVREFGPDYAVVCNATADHFPALDALAAGGFRGKVLVEKPIGEGSAGTRTWPFASLHVGYNLRFLPVLSALRDALAGEAPLAASIYCGQYLPDWRPGRDYRRSYSASARRGGGVLRDLSHELDYMLWMLGPWRRVAALGGRISALAIESDDAWALSIECRRCPVVSVQLNYLDRTPRRDVRVTTANDTYSADLLGGTLSSAAGTRAFPVDRDETYLAEHRAVLSGGSSVLCTAAEALDVMRLVEAAESAGASGKWLSAP
jgi:predicted dehydrogenase